MLSFASVGTEKVTRLFYGKVSHLEDFTCALRALENNCFSASVLDAMNQYLVLVYAGLTGSVTMITCTVLALTRLVFEYKGKPAISRWLSESKR